MKQNLISGCKFSRYSVGSALALLLLVSACKTKQTEDVNSNNDSAAVVPESVSVSTEPTKPIQGIDWGFVEIDGLTKTTGMAGSRAFLHFGMDGSVHGNSGCNNMSGSYTFVGSKLEMGPLAMTRMFCDGFMDLESKVSDVVNKAKSYGFAGDTLLLMEGDKILAKLLPIGG